MVFSIFPIHTSPRAMFGIFLKFFDFFLFCTPLVDFYRWPLLKTEGMGMSGRKESVKERESTSNW